MPWQVHKKDSQYCIYKKNPDGSKGEEVACHDSEESAMGQMRALYAKANASTSLTKSHLFGNAFREVKQGEKDYLVVPGVPVREQVMNDYWVPAQEIQHSLNGWNGTPISISHPTLNNGSVNVPAPDVAIIGRFYNAKWDDATKRMVGEYWIDLGEAGRYQEGQAIIENIRANKVLETSTGYWADDEKSVGTFGGKDYQKIHRNLLPDHIAILSKAVGACSIKDGCGVNRNIAFQNCDCDCPFRNSAMPSYQKGHLPRVMLEPYSLNKGARTAEQLDSLRAHMSEKGIDNPVVVMHKAGGEIKIIDGNHRVAMAGEFNIDQIPVKVVNEDLEEIDPEMMYAEWMHKQDQAYLSQQKKTKQVQPRATLPALKKESKMNLKELLPFLKGRGIAVKANESLEEFEVEETQTTPGPQPDAPAGLSAEELTALKGLAAFATKLNELGGVETLATLKDVPAAIALAKNFQQKEQADKDALVAAVKANSANPYSDDELAGMTAQVLTKLNAQMNVNYAGLAGGAQVFENVSQPLTIKPVMLAPVKEA